jgi:VCBS repeat-containing protein
MRAQGWPGVLCHGQHGQAHLAIKKDGTWEYVVNKCHAQRFSRVEASMMMHIARLEHPTGLYFMKEAT